MANVRTLSSPQWEYLDVSGCWIPFEREATKLAHGVVIGLPTGTPVVLIAKITDGPPIYYYLARNPWQAYVLLRNFEEESTQEQDGRMTADEPKEEGSSQTSMT
jgi:hypothetical protein